MSDNISSVYTSGRKCNFQNKGCDAEHLQPININGWFWADGNIQDSISTHIYAKYLSTHNMYR